MCGPSVLSLFFVVFLLFSLSRSAAALPRKLQVSESGKTQEGHVVSRCVLGNQNGIGASWQPKLRSQVLEDN
jgi:hypothetical protein